ncbi:uncharacterized protein SCHCODRAFT_02672590 [Schizophyllum commune H4-8]|uniref:F-box domain-containing protein n=1 Tax=Schizophyllum commune (strain H4-8 / FGSC 9210) TaxID=578458 RepID=D8QJE4_SCHCM|nr:uncharacterized protein SCHCODRAFT_02672590 [Schizophyllum commune H4-8]KAI5886362.1 hypothetical protein SCHCODRAFT_02672590 [Schizophyllum commune H4-8]
MDNSAINLCNSCDATFRIPRLRFSDDDILEHLRAIPGTSIPLSGAAEEILAVEEIVRELQEEIDGVTGLLKCLNRNMVYLHTYLTRVRSTRAPVHRLPSEILNEIFCFVMDGDYSLYDMQSTPSTLSQVCTRWRERINSNAAYRASIALRAPTLSSLDDDPHVGECTGKLKVAILHLEKSVTAPLTLRIGRHADQENVVLLMSQAYRWKDCSIHNEEALDWLSDPENQRELRNLESLKIGLRGEWKLDLGKIATLRRYTGPKMGVVLPWQQLTSLTLTSPVNASQILACLQQCTSLVSLAAEKLRYQDPDEAWVDMEVNHPCLRRLRIRAEGGHSLDEGPLLKCLTVPQLSSIELHGWHYVKQWSWDDEDVAAFGNFLRRNSAHVRSLSLCYIQLEQEETEMLLRSLPELERLEMTDVEAAKGPGELLTRSVVKGLLLDGGGARLVPRLAHISLTSYRALEIEFLSLVAALAAYRSVRQEGSLCSITLSGAVMHCPTEAAKGVLGLLEKLVNLFMHPATAFAYPDAKEKERRRLDTGHHLLPKVSILRELRTQDCSSIRRYNEDVLERLRGLSVDPLPDIDKEVLKNERAERDLQEQVIRTERLLRDLLRQLTATQDYLRRIRSVDSPVHRLPYEILDDIFALVIAESENAYSFHGMHSITTQLAHVCTRWRQRVLSSGALWASISIQRVHLPPPVTPYDKEYMRKLIDAGVQRHLRNSQGAPLRLHVGSFAEPEPIRYLLEAAPRWQEVSAEHEAMFEALNDAKVQGKLDKLRALQLVRIGPAPLRLKLDGLSALRVYNGPHIGVSLPWQQLTSLTLPKVLQTADLIMCLKLCQALTFLSVERQAATLPPNVTIDTVVHHPCLREVQLRTKSTVRPDASLFTYLNAPRLSSVSFGGFHVGQAWRGWDAAHAEALKECLNRSGAHLRSLSFMYVHVEPPVLEDLLDGLPELDFLEIKDTTDAGLVMPGIDAPPPATPLTHSTIKALLPHGPANTLRAPRLAHLALTVVEKQPFGKEIRSALHNVVERRSIRRGGSLLALSLSSTLNLESAVTADEVMAFLPTVEDLVDAYTANRRFPPRVPVKKPSYEKLK